VVGRIFRAIALARRGGADRQESRMKLRALAVLAVFLASSAAAPQSVAASGGGIAALARAYIAEAEVRDPLFADGIGVHTQDDRLADYSAAGHAARLTWLRGWRAKLAAASAGLSDTAQIADARALRDTIELELFDDAHLRPLQTDPTLYTTVLGNAIYQLTGRTYAPRAERLTHVANRLRLLPRVVAAAEAALRRPARVVTLQAMDENAGTIAMIAALPATPAIQRSRPSALRALRSFQRFLSGPLLARSDGSTRVGAAVYDRELQLAEGTDATRADLTRRARTDFAATRAQMLALALPLDRALFPDDIAAETRPDAVDVVVRRVLDRLAQDHPGRDGIFAAARDDVAAAERFIAARGVLTLPVPDTLHVTPTPAFMAGFGGASLDAPGPFTPLAQSYYYIDEIPRSWSAARVRSYLRDNNTYEMKILSLHEAMPGHYVQIRYDNATPSLVRRVFANGSFVEGWAVYVEGMMVDAGYGGSDPRLKLFQLKWRLREQANTLIDAGYHAEGMTKAQLEDLLVRQAYQERAQVDTKWHRLQLSHNQLSSYYVGLDAITRTRDAMRAALGDRFDLAAFNQALLAIGSVEPRYVKPLVARQLGVAQ
jgi:hypothetical protein